MVEEGLEHNEPHTGPGIPTGPGRAALMVVGSGCGELMVVCSGRAALVVLCTGRAALMVLGTGCGTAVLPPSAAAWLTL